MCMFGHAELVSCYMHVGSGRISSPSTALMLNSLRASEKERKRQEELLLRALAKATILMAVNIYKYFKNINKGKNISVKPVSKPKMIKYFVNSVYSRLKEPSLEKKSKVIKVFRSLCD